MSVQTDCWDVAHEWANRPDGDGIGAGGNMLYGGGAVYSYGDHFMIAKHVRNGNGARAVLFTERKYSMTTAKHIAIVRDASSHLNVIDVADPELDKEHLFDNWRDRIVSVAEKLATAQRPQKYATEIEAIYRNAQRYADFFGYEIPDLLASAGMIRNSEQFREHLAKDKAEREAADAAYNKEHKRKQTQKLKAWRAFETESFGSVDGWDYLRCNVQTCEVETTQKMRFSLDDGKALFLLICEVNATGSYSEDSMTFLGRYPIIEINNDFIRIGCHKVAMKEINRFADQQGWR